MNDAVSSVPRFRKPLASPGGSPGIFFHGDMMNLRPFATIKKLKTLVEAMEKNIELRKQLDERKDEFIASLQKRVKGLEDTCVALRERPSTVQVVGFSQIPDVEELEKLVNVSFLNAPDSILRQAVEGTNGWAQLQPGEVMATRRVLMKLCRSAAMRELERRTTNE